MKRLASRVKKVGQDAATMSNGSLMSLVIKMMENVEEMSKNQNTGKKDCLMRVHQDLCHVMQILISEPYRTSFAIPQPIELAVDDFIIQYTEKEIVDKLDENYESYNKCSGRNDDTA